MEGQTFLGPSAIYTLYQDGHRVLPARYVGSFPCPSSSEGPLTILLVSKGVSLVCPSQPVTARW